MTRFVTVVLVCAFLVPAIPARADDGPLMTSAVAAARTMQATGGNGGSGGREGLFWAGIALMGAGATMSILANTALRDTNCLVTTFAFTCIEESNKGVWAAGVAIAAAGGIMTTIGARHSVVAGPGRIGYRIRW